MQERGSLSRRIHRACAFVIEIDENVSSVSGKVGYNRIFMGGFPLSGYHKRENGTFIAYGPGIKENNRISARIYDVAPTVLHMFGVPIPKDVDGRVLHEIFSASPREEQMERMRIVGCIRALKRCGAV